MTWYPIAFLPPQYEKNDGKPYNGAVLKAYRAQTNDVIPMATGTDGATTSEDFILNAAGYPTSGGMVIIPHIQENYKLALYPDQSAADADSGAVWTVDNIEIEGEVSEPFFQEFSADGIGQDYTLDEDLGDDERTIMVFADRKETTQFVDNGDFATDTVWTKGSGWTIGSGVATATGAISTSLSQSATSPLENDVEYICTYTITRSAGSIKLNVGGGVGIERSAAGTFTETIVAAATQTIEFTTAGFTGTVDNVSVRRTKESKREIRSTSEYQLNGTNLHLDDVVPQGTKNVLVFAPSTLFGALNSLVQAAAVSEANALLYRNQAEAFRDEADDAQDAAELAQAAAEQAQASTEQTLDDAIALYGDLQAIQDAVDEAEYWALVSQSASLPPSNWTATTDPTSTDDFSDGWGLGSKWFNTLSNEIWMCADNAIGAAVWINTTFDLEDIQPLLDQKQDVNPRVQSVTSSATVTPTSANDLVAVTAQAVAMNLANPTGAMAQGQALVVRIKDAGSPCAITYGTAYRAIGSPLPATTVAGKTMYLFFVYNTTDAKFDFTGSATEY